MQSKGKRPVDRPSSYKLLEGESQKLKDKLEYLREQIKVKKQEKEMNKTMQSIGTFSGKNNSVEKMNATNYVQKEDKQLQVALTEMKMENIEGKLKERNINKLEQLISTSQEEIDKWKDIPVGYRIKLKKFIQKNRLRFNPPLNVVQNTEGISKEDKRELNIEDIIKNRKAEKVYVAIDRKNEDEEQETPELLEEEQQKMMLSILEVISVKHRKGCLKRKESRAKQEKKLVHWSQTVDEMEKNHKINKTYPKQTISKSIFQVNAQLMQKQSPESIMIQMESSLARDKGEYPNYVYCWSCLKKINSPVTNISPRQFCSKDCEAKYQQVVNPVQLLKQVQKVQVRYNNLVKQKIQAQQQDLDLSIA